MNQLEAFNIGLPAWPQCVINGDKITEEQALEIIRKTDRFFVHGGSVNNKEFNAKAREICKLPTYDNFKNIDQFSRYDTYAKAKEAFQKKWGLIKTKYIHNDWISCSWIGGPHGWCHPDGTIAFCNNIGKYAEVEEVYNDLRILGKHFPFLRLTCTLMDGEEGETYRSLVSMKLSNGEVEFIDTIPYKQLEFNGVKNHFNFYRKENYFELSQIQKWADEVYKTEEEQNG